MEDIKELSSMLTGTDENFDRWLETMLRRCVDGAFFNVIAIQWHIWEGE